MARRLLALAAVCVAVLVRPAAAGSPWPGMYTAQAQAILNSMTQAEKLQMVHGTSQTYPYVGMVPAIPRLGLPPLNLEDGPQGVADGAEDVTCWPSALTMGQSWDPNLVFAWGKAMAQEQFIKGTNVMLGPGVNLARVPWNGRNFEYLGGEDPVLASVLVAAEVAGIQSQNVSGCVKHYINNNQEYNRMTVSARVPERVEHEFYLKPFAAAVDAGVGSAMCSYNRINGTYACENNVTLNWLKSPEFLGFRGWVMSDWGATHSTVPAALAGLDQQMPDDAFFGPALAQAVASGAVPQSRLDDMVMRMLVPMLALNLVAEGAPPADRNITAPATSEAHDQLARLFAEQSIVLLQNDGDLLPLDASSAPSIAVIGDEVTVHSYGSGAVNTPYISTPLGGIYQLLTGQPLPPRAPTCTQYPGIDFYQPGVPCTAVASADDCCAACTAQTGCNAWTFEAGATCSTGPSSAAAESPRKASSGGACWMKPNDLGYQANPAVTSGICAPYNLTGTRLAFDTGANASAAAALAAGYDYAVVVVSTTSCEGSDRPDLALPAYFDALVEAVAASNPRTIVVARCPGACFMPWKASVSAILFQLMPGQEAGNALASTLFGSNNPSGKLPVSFPATMNDTWLGNPVNPEQYPGLPTPGGFLEAVYTEEMAVGYRWYDAQGTDPLWPFGHGLSYTTFGYAPMQTAGAISASARTGNVSIAAVLTNTGAVAGAEVAQLYVGYPSEAGEPPKLLKAFKKVPLAAGDSALLTFTLGWSDLAVWDVTLPGGWKVVPGAYTLFLGSSSRDIRQATAFIVAP